MVRFASLAFFATLVVSGLSIDSQTMQRDLVEISNATKDVRVSVSTFSNSRTPQNVMAIHAKGQILVTTLNRCENDMRAPYLSGAAASQALDLLNSITTDTYEALVLLNTLRSAFQQVSPGAIGVICSTLESLKTANINFVTSLKNVFTSDQYPRLNAIEARLIVVGPEAIATYCS